MEAAIGVAEKARKEKKRKLDSVHPRSETHEHEVDDEMKAVIEKYARGSLELSTRRIKHKGLKKTMKENQEKIVKSSKQNAAAEILLEETAGFIEPGDAERVYKFKQEDILQNVDLNTAKNAFDLQLTNFGPYSIDYSRNGRFFIFLFYYIHFPQSINAQFV